MAKKIMPEEVMSEESRIFRINTETIPPGEVEAFLDKIKSEFKKSPITYFPKNLYKRTLITEKVKKYKIYKSLPMLDDYFFPTR
jgi:hypothetical protein